MYRMNFISSSAPNLLDAVLVVQVMLLQVDVSKFVVATVLFFVDHHICT